jgi:hypothetical protein
MITIEEFKEIQEDQDYKHLGLFNRSGDPLVRFNSTNKSPGERLEMIEKRLKSPTLIDSVYILKAKNNTQKDTLTDDYIIVKDQETMKQTHTMPDGSIMPGATHIETLSEHKTGVYNFKEGIELNSKLIRAELENDHLKIRIQELERVIEDLEDQLKEAETLGDEQKTPIQDFLQETLKTAIPIFDKFIELKERKIQLAEQGATQTQQAPENPEFRNLNQDGADILDEKIKAFILVQDPETQDYLKQCYNSSNTLDGFFTMVDNYDEDLFNNLKTSLNGGS